MKKKFIAGILSVLMMGTLVGCSSGNNASKKAEGESKETSGKKIVIGLSMNTLNNPFFVDVKDGAVKAAGENGAEIIVTDAQNQPNKQLTDIENLIQKKPDVLIIDPADSEAVISAIETANEKKIPVITIDRASKGGEVVSHIGFDAIHSGNIAGDYIAKALSGKGKVVEIMGIMGTNVAQDRSKGFNEAIAKNPNIKVVAQQSADFDRAKAMTVMENILQANPEIDAVYAANDEMALGALEAIEASGRLDKITLIGCDAIDPAIAAIKAGKQEATIAEPPFFLGKNAVQTALKVLKGESVEKNVILDSTLVTKENVDTLKTKE
ncbi:substrate-binding domain-containing protein [Clostridium bovifaecis]|uniref:Substrate-binding domain-containing protein n=1 Tax=Clostridium bovifaecis TaxID=2184719 RepID=A0A6I6F1M4_9CLOT|nr:substrate-binding domain-containing protein [Clostridium bovifaecis]